MINFKKLRWKNFLSYGNVFTELDLSSHKTSLIVGPNGVGKTTIIDALCFVLYNKSFRNTNKPLLVNSITQKNMLVEAEIEVRGKQYLIRRGMRPNVFEIYKNGELVNQTTGAIDYQTILEKQILKMNFKSFTQIVILGSSNYTPFMKLTAQARREIIEDLLDIQVFSIMANALKEKKDRNVVDLAYNGHQWGLYKVKVDMAEKHIEAMKANQEEAIQYRHNKIVELTKDIEAAQAKENEAGMEWAEINEYLTKVETALGRKKKLIRVGSQLEDKLVKINQEIKFYWDNANCPTCKQDIAVAFREDIIKAKTEQKELLEHNIESLKEDKEDIKRMEEARVQYSRNQTDLSQTITQCQTQVRMLNGNIKAYESEIELLKEKKVESNDDIDAYRQHVVELETEKKRLLQLEAIYNVAAILLKDGGIKTRIVRQYIPVMNNLINKTLELMNFYCQFTIDENFNEKINSRFRDEFNYESFSEGEKKRIDLALMFTWREISRLRNGARCNILIFDEVLDGSLDNEGMEDLIKIVKVLTADTNTFVITHKSDQFLDKFERVMTFSKHKNFSQMSIS